MYSIHLLFDEPNNNKIEHSSLLCYNGYNLTWQSTLSTSFQEGGMNKIAVKHKYFNKDSGITYLYIFLL